MEYFVHGAGLKICVDCFVQGGKSVLTVLCRVVNLR